MRIEDYLRILRARWLIVVACFMLVTAGAVVTSFLLPPQYAASTRLFVTVADRGSSPPGVNDPSVVPPVVPPVVDAPPGLDDMYQGGLFSAQRTISYTELLTSEDVAQRTIDALNLDTTADELIEKVTATSAPDSVLIDVSVQDSSAERAALIANELSDQFVSVVGELERTNAGQPGPELVVAQRATVPDEPVSPRKKLNVALGMIVGLLLGLGLAILRDRLDKSVKTVREIEDLTGSAVIGKLPRPDKPGRNGVPASRATDSALEDYRNLRTSLQFRDVDNPPRVFVVTSTTHREERYPAALNLAVVLGKAEHTVALVEADFRWPDSTTDVDEHTSGLSDVLAGTQPLDRILRRSQLTGVSLLGGGPNPPNPSEVLGSDAAYMVFNELRTRFDYVVVAGPPLLPYTDATLVARQTDGAVLIVHPGVTSRHQLVEAVAKLTAVNARLLGIVTTSPGRRGLWRRFRRHPERRRNNHGAVATKEPVRAPVRVHSS